MKKIKNYIIHLLGGYTQEEVSERSRTNYKNAVTDIRLYLESIDGTPADEWCKLAYEFVCKQ